MEPKPQSYRELLAGGRRKEAQEGDDLRQERYEEVVVKKVLSFYQLTAAKPRLLARHRDVTGQNHLSLTAFGAEYPDFPFEMAARRVKHTLRLYQDLVERWTKTELFRALTDAFPDPADRPRALVFPWASWETMVLHDRHPPAGPGFWFLRRLPGGALIVLEPLKQFLGQTVGTDWLD